MALRVFPENLSSIGPEIDFLKSTKFWKKITECTVLLLVLCSAMLTVHHPSRFSSCTFRHYFKYLFCSYDRCSQDCTRLSRVLMTTYMSRVGLWFSKIYHYNQCIVTSDVHSLRSNREHLFTAWPCKGVLCSNVYHQKKKNFFWRYTTPTWLTHERMTKYHGVQSSFHAFFLSNSLIFRPFLANRRERKFAEMSSTGLLSYRYKWYHDFCRCRIWWFDFSFPIVISDISLQPICTGGEWYFKCLLEVLILIFVNPIIISGKYPVTLYLLNWYVLYCAFTKIRCSFFFSAFSVVKRFIEIKKTPKWE